MQMKQNGTHQITINIQASEKCLKNAHIILILSIQFL